jgi:hypothetical protein
MEEMLDDRREHEDEDEQGQGYRPEGRLPALRAVEAEQLPLVRQPGRN